MSRIDSKLTALDLKTEAGTATGWLVNHVRGAVHLVRLPNLVMVAVGVFVGGALSTDRHAATVFGSKPLALAALSALLITAAANTLNDALDVEIDRINRPHRPIVVGQVSRHSAVLLSVLLAAAGIFIALQLSPAHTAVAVAVTGLMLAYDVWLKRLPLIGNIAVSVGVSATLFFGALTFDDVGGASAGVVFAFVTTLTRELVKDLEDMTGDAHRGSMTLPIVAGQKFTTIVVLLLLGLSLVLIPVPYLVLGYSGLYLLFAAVAAASFIAAMAAILRLQRSYSSASLLIKVGMLGGLSALFVSHVPE